MNWVALQSINAEPVISCVQIATTTQICHFAHDRARNPIRSLLQIYCFRLRRGFEVWSTERSRGTLTFHKFTRFLIPDHNGPGSKLVLIWLQLGNEINIRAWITRQGLVLACRSETRGEVFLDIKSFMKNFNIDLPIFSKYLLQIGLCTFIFSWLGMAYISRANGRKDSTY